jgi:hypothetical protein
LVVRNHFEVGCSHFEFVPHNHSAHIVAEERVGLSANALNQECLGLELQIVELFLP